MITLSPVPQKTPIIDQNSASSVSFPWLRWFINLVQVFAIPQSAYESTVGAGAGTMFSIPTAAPNPPSSLMVFVSGLLVAPSAYYLVGQIITFYVSPGATPHVSYQY